MNINNFKIAIIHDWFLKNSISGAEKVTSFIDKLLIKNYAKPDIFSLTSNLEAKNQIFEKGRKINTSSIQLLPFGKTNVQNYLPLLPFAIEQINLSKYDLILSSSHAFSKGIITSPDQLHISYIHTPMRYAWDQMNTYLKRSTLSRYGFNIPIRYLLFKLREWDFYSSQRIDFLISNSNFTAKRIKKYWGLDSEVINPPVNVEKFDYKQNRGDFYLSVNRLVPNKRIDLIVEAFNVLGLPLIIIGDGPERKKIEKISNPNIKFLGKSTDEAVKDYMSKCRAFVYAGLEDFGIAPVEALAAGAPVIAYGKGGILDTINCINNPRVGEITNGLLFKNQRKDTIIEAINWFEDRKLWEKFSTEGLHNYSRKFNIETFNNKIDLFINNAINKFKKN